jgi:hypothetical protein
MFELEFEFERFFSCPAPTTTPEPTTPVSTTTPPAWAPCADLTGRWEAVNPNASVCLTVDYSSGSANLVGLYRNGSDTFWMTITGMTREGKFDELGWAVLWPGTLIGVSSYAGRFSKVSGESSSRVKP